MIDRGLVSSIVPLFVLIVKAQTGFLFKAVTRLLNFHFDVNEISVFEAFLRFPSDWIMKAIFGIPSWGARLGSVASSTNGACHP